MGLKQRLSLLKETQKEAEGELPESGGELVVVKDGKAVTSSIEFAAHFQKGHDHVMRDIRNSGSSPEFRSLHFWRDQYTDQMGRTYPMYWMDRDAFTFVAMSLTGKKAAHFKEKYIAAFNAMEKKLMGDMREMSPRKMA